MKSKTKKSKVELFNPNNKSQQDALQEIFQIASKHGILLIAVTDEDFTDAQNLYEEQTDKKVVAKFTKQEVHDFRENIMQDMMNTYCEVVRYHYVETLNCNLAKK